MKILLFSLSETLLLSRQVISASFPPHGLQHRGLPVPHYLPEFAQVHVHWIGDAVQPSHPLSVNPKGNQPWIFIGRTDAEAEAPILWPPDANSRLIGKDPVAGKHQRQSETLEICKNGKQCHSSNFFFFCLAKCNYFSKNTLFTVLRNELIIYF